MENIPLEIIEEVVSQIKTFFSKDVKISFDTDDGDIIIEISVDENQSEKEEKIMEEFEKWFIPNIYKKYDGLNVTLEYE